MCEEIGIEGFNICKQIRLLFLLLCNPIHKPHGVSAQLFHSILKDNMKTFVKKMPTDFSNLRHLTILFCQILSSRRESFMHNL